MHRKDKKSHAFILDLVYILFSTVSYITVHISNRNCIVYGRKRNKKQFYIDAYYKVIYTFRERKNFDDVFFLLIHLVIQ